MQLCQCFHFPDPLFMQSVLLNFVCPRNLLFQPTSFSPRLCVGPWKKRVSAKNNKAVQNNQSKKSGRAGPCPAPPPPSKTSTDKGNCLGYAMYAKWLAHEWTIIKPLACMPLDAGLALRAWRWEPSAKNPALRANAESLGTALSAESLALRAQCKVQH